MRSLTAILVAAALALPLPAHATSGFAVAPVLIISTALLEVLIAPTRITEALTVTSSGLAVGLAMAAPAAGVLIDEVSANSGYLLVSGAALAAAVLMLFAAGPLHRLESRR